jgi:hypothetical protein
MDVANISAYLTLLIACISIVSTLISVGAVFGLLKGKISSLDTDIKHSNDLFSSNISKIKSDIRHNNTNQADKLKVVSDKIDDKFQSSTEKINALKYKVDVFDDKYNNLRNHVDVEVKDINREIKKITDNCLLRQHNIDNIPDLSERVKKLEIEVGVLPTKLSDEISMAFSNEYKKLVNSLSKTKNSNV